MTYEPTHPYQPALMKKEAFSSLVGTLSACSLKKSYPSKCEGYANEHSCF